MNTKPPFLTSHEIALFFIRLVPTVEPVRWGCMLHGHVQQLHVCTCMQALHQNINLDACLYPPNCVRGFTVDEIKHATEGQDDIYIFCTKYHHN